MILSHCRAGTGAVLVETREEQRLLRSILAELPENVEVCTVVAATGELQNARTGQPEQKKTGLQSGYQWAMDAPNRVLVVYDWHMLVNNPGHWRSLISALPGIQDPKDYVEESGDYASLVVFVGPTWDLQPQNPLRGAIPILPFEPPDRSSLMEIAARLCQTNGLSDAVVDALCGLAADTAIQVASECLAAKGKWDTEYLRVARREALSHAGLLIEPGVSEIGGLAGLRSYAAKSILPWARDLTLGVRRVFFGGLPGTGKTFGAAWLAGQLGCELAILDLSQLQGSLVGQSQAATRAATRTIDALGREAPIVVLLDEIDTVAKSGLDGGASGGQWSWLVGWLQRTLAHQTIVIAASNYPDRIDPALLRRFPVRFAFDFPTAAERAAIAAIHYRRVGCEGTPAEATAQLTEGCSSAQLAEEICPEVTRRSNRKAPDTDLIRAVMHPDNITPAANMQTEQLAKMRQAIAGFRRANDPLTVDLPATRRVQRN